MLEAGITPGGVMEVSSYHVILACVSAGAGFAVVPHSVLDAVAVKGQMQVFPVPGKASKVNTLLAWRADFRSAKLDALREILVA